MMIETSRQDGVMDRTHRIETAGESRLPIVSWCCTCDKELTLDDGIGPWNHLAGEGGGDSDHYVIQVVGRLDVYRQIETSRAPS